MNTKKVAVTMPEDVIQKVKELADLDNRSFSNMVATLVAEALKNKAV